MSVPASDTVPRPVCSCHGWGACVHDSNYTPAADGHDGERGWDWHCILRDCESFSAVLLVRPEWVPAEPPGSGRSMSREEFAAFVASLPAERHAEDGVKR